MELEKYDLIQMIGVGSYGQVYRAREIATNRSIAVKLIKKVSLSTIFSCKNPNFLYQRINVLETECIRT